MLIDYDEYLNKCEDIREINNQLLNLFAEDLAESGLTDKTIRRHISNVDFYINEFLLYEDALTMESGAGMLEHNKIPKEDYDFLCSEIKDSMKIWQEQNPHCQNFCTTRVFQNGNNPAGTLPHFLHIHRILVRQKGLYADIKNPCIIVPWHNAVLYHNNFPKRIRISSPRPLNSARISEDSIFELLHVTYKSTFRSFINPGSTSTKPSFDSGASKYGFWISVSGICNLIQCQFNNVLLRSS